MKIIKGKIININGLTNFSAVSIEEWKDNINEEQVQHRFVVNIPHKIITSPLKEGMEIMVCDYTLTAKATHAKNGGVFYPLNIWAQSIYILSDNNNKDNTTSDSDSGYPF